MTLVRFRAPQLVQVTLDVGRIERCAQRLSELTENLVLSAPGTKSVDRRTPRALAICGEHVWIALHPH